MTAPSSPTKKQKNDESFASGKYPEVFFTRSAAGSSCSFLPARHREYPGKLLLRWGQAQCGNEIAKAVICKTAVSSYFFMPP